jgi:dienelactone hydrolase
MPRIRFPDVGRARTVGAVLAATLAVAATPAAASSGSLYGGPAPRPGPSILYAKPARAPQLANAGIWRAKPILVSGASAYRSGEFLYQDFLYDDHGARGAARDPGDPRAGGDAFSGPNGTYTYPTSAAYADNAADLVELRVKPLADATAFRITLNTLKNPSLVATTIAIGSSAAPRPFPFGADVSGPAKLFLTVHGTDAELDRAATGAAVGPAPTVSVSKRRRQIEVIVPHRAWDPGARRVRLAAGVGLWDQAADRYLIPGVAADASHPGGAAGLPNPPAFFNVAFRYHEPWPDLASGGGVGSIADPAWWRDKQQAAALAKGDISPFHATVDFGKLERGVRDDGAGKPWGVPASGPMDRILASRFATGAGADYSVTCTKASECLGELRGQLQPYAIYVPAKPAPPGGYGLTLLLHSLAANYNQFSASRNQSQFGDRGPGSIVITPEGRGPDGWYYGETGADTFEVWADVARRYRLDPSWTDIAGYSMGGYGTYKFAAQYPDLFARAQPTVGPPGLGVWAPPADPVPGGAASNTNRMLASVRNIPFLIWDGVEDELVPVAGPLAQVDSFDRLGYRYRFDLFTTADHLLLAANDQYAPAAAFLGTAKVKRNPFHITYVVNPTMDFAADGTVADHAYWLSGLRLRDPSGPAPLGRIDAVSAGFGRRDPPPRPTEHSTGTLTGGNVAPLVYTEQSKGSGSPASVRRRDALRIEATNLARVVVHPARARLDCDARVAARTDGPLAVHLAGCGRTLRFGG